MSKVVFMFPGQGAQYIGMGKDFYDACEESKAVYELASKVTGLDIAKLCFEENEEINITEYTQIAMLTTEAAIYATLKKGGKEPAACAGLSLGEYGALIASGVMSMEDAFRVVRARGIFMQEAVPTGGAMAAVLGLDAKAIEEVCSNTEGIVSIANYNCPGQIVITGEEAAVEKAGAALKEAGAKRGSIKSKWTVPFRHVNRSRRKISRSIGKYKAAGLHYSICNQCDGRLRYHNRTGKRTVKEAGIFFCKMAAEHRASDCRRL